MQKNVLITGASSGIGNATAFKLAQKGYRVFACARKEADKQALNELHSNIYGVILDVTDENSIKEAFEEIKTQTSELYAIINNAGIAIVSPVEYLPIECVKKQFDVNVWGAISVAQTFLPLLKNGRIINLSSVASFGLAPFLAPYCVSKKALDMFFNLLSAEIKRDDIKIISIKPGVIKTPLWNKSHDLNFPIIKNLPQKAQEDYKEEFDFIFKLTKVCNENGIDVQNVVNVIIKALEAKKPKHSYLVGNDAKFGSIVSKLPESILFKLVRKVLKSRVKIANSKK